MASLIGEIQIVEATVLGMLDDDRALIGFSGGPISRGASPN
jgi:hypothetical protein